MCERIANPLPGARTHETPSPRTASLMQPPNAPLDDRLQGAAEAMAAFFERTEPKPEAMPMAAGFLELTCPKS